MPKPPNPAVTVEVDPSNRHIVYISQVDDGQNMIVLTTPGELVLLVEQLCEILGTQPPPLFAINVRPAPISFEVHQKALANARTKAVDEFRQRNKRPH